MDHFKIWLTLAIYTICVLGALWIAALALSFFTTFGVFLATVASVIGGALVVVWAGFALAAYIVEQIESLK